MQFELDCEAEGTDPEEASGWKMVANVNGRPLSESPVGPSKRRTRGKLNFPDAAVFILASLIIRGYTSGSYACDVSRLAWRTHKPSKLRHEL